MKYALITTCALAGSLLVSTGAVAKDWFDTCAVTAAGADKTKYIGGAANKAHLHVGSNFIDDTRNPTGLGGRYTTDFPKAQLANKCTSLKQWKSAIKLTDASQYEKPNDVAACLTAFMANLGCP